jgi:hypothetical protein
MNSMIGCAVLFLAGALQFTRAAESTGAKADSGSRRLDSLGTLLGKRNPGVSLYLGVDFIDFDAKEKFQSSLNTRIAKDSLNALQNFESVHLAFPIGIQAVVPISTYLDVVAKTHSYWYKQTAILGNKKTNTHAGEDWYVVQANLVGGGMRYYLPPTLLSVSGQLGLYTQGVWYWNLGNTELYSPHGNARARFAGLGSGYEIQVGFQQTLIKPWKLTGAIGYLHHEFSSSKSWKDLLPNSPALGKVSWGSSAVQANLNLWYHFGIVAPAPVPKTAPADSSRRL